ncbi:MAG: NUDIX domain-containing protein [Verrucomicrobia bacterium]|nr:MAG: NUDIX domain-containing protein [Verrucomicrobiota bacterium]
MRSKTSAGLVVYRFRDGRLEVFLAHPGGPYFARKDEGHWSIPKGEVAPGEELFQTALREFEEEVGVAFDPQEPFLELGSIRQKGGKTVHAWAVERDFELKEFPPTNAFTMEWPKGSGRMQTFPEIDRARFFPLAEARRFIKAEQWPLIERLVAALQEQGRLPRPDPSPPPPPDSPANQDRS